MPRKPAADSLRVNVPLDKHSKLALEKIQKKLSEELDGLPVCRADAVRVALLRLAATS